MHLEWRVPALELVLRRGVEVELHKVVAGSGERHVSAAPCDRAFFGFFVVPGRAAGWAVGVLADVLDLDLGAAIGDPEPGRLGSTRMDLRVMSIGLCRGN
ncbi:hypothetical protein [Kibdelosporangium philippinense]|uniref:hypothetical protein n=1 Tax=Kibdelosporangium philippinense TaxID=211113 RepID=UPI003608E910